MCEQHALRPAELGVHIEELHFVRGHALKEVQDAQRIEIVLRLTQMRLQLLVGLHCLAKLRVKVLNDLLVPRALKLLMDDLQRTDLLDGACAFR